MLKDFGQLTVGEYFKYQIDSPMIYQLVERVGRGSLVRNIDGKDYPSEDDSGWLSEQTVLVVDAPVHPIV